MKLEGLLTIAACLCSTRVSAVAIQDPGATGSTGPGYLKLNAIKKRGIDYQHAVAGAEPVGRLAKRDGTVEFTLDNAQTFYEAEIEIGSAKQKVGVLVDTGSSDLWVVNSNNSMCAAGTGGSSGSNGGSSGSDSGSSAGASASAKSGSGSSSTEVLHSQVSYHTETVTQGASDYGGDYGTDYYYTEDSYSTETGGFFRERKQVDPSLIRNRTLYEIQLREGDSEGEGEDKGDYFAANKTVDVNAKGILSDLFGGGEATTSTVAATATIDCSEYGTFDADSSDSFKSNGTSFAIKYADQTYAKGWWGVDTVVVDGTTIKDLSLAACDDTDNNLGVMGIGLAGLETTYGGSSDSSQTSMYTYDNVPLKLKTLGLIETAAYSIYLNDTDSSKASVLFGGIDHDKYSGELTKFPIINSLANYGYSSPLKLEITLNSITVGSSSEGKEVEVAAGAAPALLDTGTTLTYIPGDVLAQIQSKLSLKYNSNVGYYMTCTEADDTFLTFNFQGRSFQMPLSSFLIPLTTTGGAISSYCALGLEENSDSTFTLGDSFLRNVYFVADLDNLEIGLATAKLNSTEENIEKIASSIPSAVSAKSYTDTWSVSETLGSVDGTTEGVSATSTGSSNDAKATSSSSTSSSSSGSSSGSSGVSKGAASGNYVTIKTIVMATAGCLFAITFTL